MGEIFSQIFTVETLNTTIRLATPITLAALGAIFTSRAGVLNLNLEGTMLAAALGAVFGQHFIYNHWAVGLLSAMLIGTCIAGILAYVGIYLKANLVLAGTALNLFVQGLTIFCLFLVTGEKGAATTLNSSKVPILFAADPSKDTFAQTLIEYVRKVPVLGRLLTEHYLLTWIAVIAVFVASFVLFKTSIGLRIRAVGENPHAAESVGINVNRIKTMSLLICGMFASLGGAFMSMAYMSTFNRDMTAGRGFIALAAMNLGNATPVPTMLASILFGFSEAISNILQAMKIPPQLVVMVPYAITIFGLVFYAIRRDHKIKKLRAAR